MKRKKYGTRLTIYIGSIGLGFIISSLIMVSVENSVPHMVDVIVLSSVALTFILSIGLNMGNSIVIEDGYLKQNRFFKEKQSIKLENFDFERKGSDKIIVKNDEEEMTFKIAFIGPMKLDQLMKALKPLSNNKGVKEAKVMKAAKVI